MAKKSKYTKLELLVLDHSGTYQNFADDVGMSRVHLYNKLNGKSEWKRSDILKFCDTLNIAKEDVFDYFFAP